MLINRMPSGRVPANHGRTRLPKYALYSPHQGRMPMGLHRKKRVHTESEGMKSSTGCAGCTEISHRGYREHRVGRRDDKSSTGCTGSMGLSEEERVHTEGIGSTESEGEIKSPTGRTGDAGLSEGRKEFTQRA